MNIGVFGGSFNPVHKGHIKMARQLIQKKLVDKIIFVPTGNYWDKTNLIDINHRIHMLTFYQNKNILIDTKRYKYEYTYQVIKSIKEEYKCDNIFLIIGADNVEKFHLWKNVNEILENKVLVIGRNGLNVQKNINKFQLKDQFIVVNGIKEINVSSTQIREKIKNKESLDGLLDENVIKYIYKEKLYGDDISD